MGSVLAEEAMTATSETLEVEEDDYYLGWSLKSFLQYFSVKI